MSLNDTYVHKSEVNWSLLKEGLTLPVKEQVIFGRNMGALLKRGQSRDINLVLSGKTYEAKIRNVNFDKMKYQRSDVLQIRYPKDGELAKAFQSVFWRSYGYILDCRNSRNKSDRSRIIIPDDMKEYVVIYMTGFEDTYLVEPIYASDIYDFRESIVGQSEKLMEDSFNYDINDGSSNVLEVIRSTKIRKLNRSIGDNLKLLYDYRCQICGQKIGVEFGARVSEAHHIEYFIQSMNNDASNQMIVCPNHHSIIHDVNPMFDHERLMFCYQNGYEEKLVLNRHL